MIANMSTKINVVLKSRARENYSILLGDGVFYDWSSWLPLYCLHKQLVIITDKIVENLYAREFSETLMKHGYNVLLLSIESGESSKVQTTKDYIELEMLKAKFGRHTLLLALGGGVVGDLAGFIAATYMRGIPYIQIPTTLLAMVDSSIGGKTAINTPYGKNMIGAIYQPKEVVVDLSMLSSINKLQIVNGLIEALKIFLTLDSKSFFYAKANIKKVLEKNTTSLKKVISKAIKLKIQVVKIDEDEQNYRMILNFGHTIGHAIEKLSNYNVLHGYAVALGILVEAKISQLMGVLSSQNYQIIVDTFKSVGISKEMLNTFNANEVISIAKGDKKNQDGKIYCVLIKDIGSVYIINERVATLVHEKYILEAFKALS